MLDVRCIYGVYCRKHFPGMIAGETRYLSLPETAVEGCFSFVLIKNTHLDPIRVLSKSFKIAITMDRMEFLECGIWYFPE